MTREQVMELFERREAFWRSRDAAALAADHAADGVVVSPTGGVLEGREEIERVYRLWLTAFPDLMLTVTDVLIDGDRAVLLVNVDGTHAGDFLGLAGHGPACPLRRRPRLYGQGQPHRARAADPRFHRRAGPGRRAESQAGGRTLERIRKEECVVLGN